MPFASEVLVHSPGSSAASPPRSAVNFHAALDQPDECVGWKRVERSLPQVWLPTRGPLCTVAGSRATIAMLVERDAPSLLAAQGFAWLGIDATGKRRGTLAATP